MTTRTLSGATSRAVRRTAVFVERARKLPETNRTRRRATMARTTTGTGSIVPSAMASGAVDAVADLVGGVSAAVVLRAPRPGGQIAAIATPVLHLDSLLDANITFHELLIQDH